MSVRTILLVALIAICGGNVRAQQTWVWQNPLPQGNHFVGVEFIDANVGTLTGDFGTILRTTNGGATWLTQTRGVTVHLRGGSYFHDANTGTVVGDEGTILQ